MLAAEAESDLQAIYNQRLAQQGATEDERAEASSDRLVDAIASLADLPFKGLIPPELQAVGIADWRQLSLSPYRIIYTVEADVATIAIVADGGR